MSYRFAVLDTETNALANFTLPADDPKQPRLAAFSILPLDDDWNVIPDAGLTTLVKPDGWTIAPEITAINGLTTERCEAEGIPLENVLTFYQEIILQGFCIAAYNAQFDCKIMRGELRRMGMDDLFEATKNTCIMRSTGGLEIPKAGGKRGWPKLSDAYRYFYDGDSVQPSPHTAGGDAETARLIMLGLRRVGHPLIAPTVHYAKNHP